ncbi:MAG: translation initiation factor [Chthoniobacterales bacterium]
MAKKKTRVPVHGGDAGLTGNPFGMLDGASLPPGPELDSAAELASATEGGATGRVVLRREKARRGGKTVVVVGSFAGDITDDRLEDLAKRARQQCGCGGTVRKREIELQGGDSAKVRAFFEDEGFRVAGV